MVDIAVRHKIARARSHWASLVGVEGAAWTAAILFGASLFCFHIDWNLALTAQQRLACWALGGILLTACLLALVARPYLRPRTDEAVAAQVERKYPTLKERLLSTVEFGRLGDPAARGLSRPMVEALSQETSRVTADLDFRRAFGLEGVKRSGTVMALSLALFALHAFLLPNAMGAWFDRMLHPFGGTPVWRDTRVQVEPLRGKVLKGGTLQVWVNQEGRRVGRGELRFQFGKGRQQRVRLVATPDGRFNHRFVGLTENIRYRATAGDGLSDEGTVEVVDPPAVLGAELQFTYPAYMEKPVERVKANTAGIAAPHGTRVSLTLKANKPLRAVEMLFPGQAPVAWQAAGEEVKGTLDVRADGSYSLNLTDTDSFRNPQPLTFPIKSIADQTPEVQIQEPSGDLEVVPEAHVPLKLYAKDDYGVQSVRLNFRVGEGKPRLQAVGAGEKRKPVVEGEITWHMASLKLKPGDVIRYRAEALDWDNLTGPHVGKTGEYQIRVLDRAEFEAKFQARQKELLEALKQLIKEQKAAKAAVETQRSSPKPDAAKIGDAEQTQRSLATEASDLARRLQELNRSARMNNLSSADEARAQQAAEQTLNDVAGNAMPRAANQIAQAAPNAQANPEQSRNELGNAANQQQEILRRLQEVEQSLQPGSDLQRLANRAQRLAGDQRNLRDRAARLLQETLGRSMSELTQQQREALGRLAQDQQTLQRATEQLQQDVQAAAARGDRDPAVSEAVRAAAAAMQEAGIPQTQNQAAQNVQQNNLGQANTQQNQAARDLQNLAEALRNAQAANDPKNLQRQLQQAMQQLRRMMNQQQQAMDQTRANPNEAQRNQIAEQERRLAQQAQEMRRRLEQLQRQAPSAGRAAQSLNQASGSMSQAGQSVQNNQQQQAMGQQQQAMEQLQNAMQSLEQAMQEAGANDDPFAALRKALQELAAKQRSVHTATQRIDSGSKNGLQEPEKQELGQLAGQQQGIDGQSEGLERELPGDVFRRFMGDARKQMQRSLEGLKASNPADRPTRRAQRRAADILEQLARALDPDPDDNSEGAGGGGGGGGGGEVDPELLKRLSELRLLRIMERGIRDRTQSLDDGREPNQPLTPEQEEELKALAGAQEDARAMAERVAELLRRHRQLAGKVQQAGGHMGEAKKGLDRNITGDPTQEEENQAILRLTEALKATQRMAQSQSQRPGQQQGAQNRMPGSQGGRTPGISGRIGAREADMRYAGRDGGGRGFSGLEGRDFEALRQGSREKVPAEFRDLINRYYKALGNQGAGGR